MIEYHRTIKIMLIKTYLLSWKHFCVYREKNRNASRTVYGPAARGVWPAAGLARSGGTVAVRWDGDGAEPGPPRRPGGAAAPRDARPSRPSSWGDRPAAAPRGTHGCVQRVMLDPGNGPGLCIYCAFKSLFRVHFLLLI